MAVESKRNDPTGRAWLWLSVAGVGVGIILGVGLGLALGSWSAAEPGGGGDASQPSRRELAAEVALLRAALDGEGRARDELAWRLADAAARIDELSTLVLEADSPALEEELEARVGREPGKLAAEQSAARRNWFDAEALYQAGIDPPEIEELRERWERFVMNKLEVVDLAARQGRSGKPGHRRRLRGLDRQFRANLGDEDYDAMLYATGRVNRVVVEGLIGHSPGDRAGLQTGDSIWSYAGRRIFAPAELQRVTTQGERGELVPVEVTRDGELTRLYLPRGPMGALLNGSRVAPDNG